MAEIDKFIIYEFSPYIEQVATFPIQISCMGISLGKGNAALFNCL